MRASNVLVRFLSLLDVALILLGVLMIVLMYSQVRTSKGAAQAAEDRVASLVDIEFVYLYAGCKGEQNGRCYLLGKDGGISREVRTDTDVDIREILAERSVGQEKRNQVVMLVFGDDSWDSAWDAKRQASIEQAWKLKVVPLYNVPLSR